jgi:hypothetical protein
MPAQIWPDLRPFEMLCTENVPRAIAGCLLRRSACYIMMLAEKDDLADRDWRRREKT